MSKSKKRFPPVTATDEPAVDGASGGNVTTCEEPVELESSTTATQDDQVTMPAVFNEVTVSIPELPSCDKLGYQSLHVDMRLLGRPKVAQFVKRLTLALESREERLSDGKRVRGSGPALLWLIEQLAGQV